MFRGMASKRQCMQNMIKVPLGGGGGGVPTFYERQNKV